MTDEEKKTTITKPLDVGKVTTADGLTNFAAKPSIHSRIANAQKVREAQAVAAQGIPKFINFGRIFILPDCSGSMDSPADAAMSRGRNFQENAPTRLDMMKQAVAAYLQNCVPLANLVGVASFPEGAFATPSGNYADVRMQVDNLNSSGGTPMSEAMGYVLEAEKFTHAVLISDGCPDSTSEVEQLAREYKEKKITVDCVHIGGDTSGEALMKQVAEVTGGAYIKFTDTLSFAKTFQYLAPAKRGFLTAHKNPVALLGAAEVKL